MTEHGAPATMDDLLAANEAAWMRLRALVASSSASALITAQDAGGWSGKDHLAHLAAWERGMLHVLADDWPQWQGMGISPDLFATRKTEGVDRINEELRRLAAERPLGDVLIELESVHEMMQATIRTLGDEGLNRPVGDFRHDGTELPVIEWIPGDACDHFDEHAGYIAIILGKA